MVLDTVSLDGDLYGLYVRFSQSHRAILFSAKLVFLNDIDCLTEHYISSQLQPKAHFVWPIELKLSIPSYSRTLHFNIGTIFRSKYFFKML